MYRVNSVLFCSSFLGIGMERFDAWVLGIGVDEHANRCGVARFHRSVQYGVCMSCDPVLDGRL